MEEKKEAYVEYRKARGEMRNLLTVKAMWIGCWAWKSRRPERIKNRGRNERIAQKAFVERATTE